ncbi:MAG TPA: histidine kinase, partial [Roseimicrobium sp.]|nr:histidine kinase [Roseimicrobium sp.]
MLKVGQVATHHGARDETHADTRRELDELQKAKAEMDASLKKYTDLYDLAPVGYFSIDEAGVILDVNLTGAALLGVARSRLIKRRFQLFMAPPNRMPFDVFLKSIFTGQKKQVCETPLLRTDRRPFWADLQAMSAVVDGGARKWCRVAVIDVSARKRAEEAQRRVDELARTNRNLEKEIVRRHAEEALLKKNEQRALQSLKEAEALQAQLRQMARQLLMVEENQRKQISRELHDKICQLLVGINVHLALFAKTAASDPKGIRRTLVPLRRLVIDGVKTVHRFARDLRPSALDDLGLITALRTYIADFPKRKGRQIQLSSFPGV